jgi:hypothetical protein
MKLAIKNTIWITVELNSLANKQDIIDKLEANPNIDPRKLLKGEDGIDEISLEEDSLEFITCEDNGWLPTVELKTSNNHNLWTND